MRANPLTPNLWAGFVITASLPASTVLFISELLAEGVAPIPLDVSTVVEGTVCTTAVSSPDDKVRGILAVCNTRFIKEHKSSNHIRARIKSHVYTTE